MSRLAAAYSLSDVGATRSLYDEWAATYDAEMSESSQDYVAPASASAHLFNLLGPDLKTAKILDAGCGTGLVGVHLAQLGASEVDGLDLSPGMLDVARRTGAYKSLNTADLSKPLGCQNDSYRAIVCIGTLTQGHVGPEPLAEFVRVVQKGGFIVTTVLGSIWESGRYAAEVAALAQSNKVEVLSAELEDYRRGVGVQARMVVLRVL
jgi:ubiquinone/menaquinone biosynthesis C-methylase UbiE